MVDWAEHRREIEKLTFLAQPLSLERIFLEATETTTFL